MIRYICSLFIGKNRFDSYPHLHCQMEMVPMGEVYSIQRMFEIQFDSFDYRG